MGGRRILPLIFVVLACALVTLLRLWQIQVHEHAVWAEQARKLQHSGEVLPYERGAIRDAAGDPLVRDARVYRLELTYRDFRRGHPLGQIAHARAALELRPVGLLEARSWMLRWGGELIGLSPAGLYDFARGGALETASLQLARTDQPYSEQRPLRASDLRYYVRALLDLDRLERRRLVKAERSGQERRSYLELLAGMRGVEPGALALELEAAWALSVERLGELASRLQWGGEGQDEEAVPGAAPRPLDAITAELERWRRAIENAAASRLFRDVAGFDAGRVDAHTLLSRIDLDWMELQMRWDAPRLAEWAAQARFDWLRSWREGYALPRVLAQVQLSKPERVDANFLISMLASLHGGPLELQRALDGDPLDWRQRTPPEVLRAVGGLFADAAPLPRAEAALPILDPELVAAAAGDPGFELLVDERLMEPGRAAEVAAQLIEELGERRWAALYGGRIERLLELELLSSSADDRDRVRRVAEALLDSWETRLQRALVERFDALSANAPGQRLRFAEDRMDRIAERALHLLRDHGSRSVALHEEPDYEVVYLITRQPGRFPGIRIMGGRRREAVPYRGSGGGLTGTGQLLAAELMGNVGALDAAWVQRQRESSGRLRELQRKPARSTLEDQLLTSLMQELLLDDEALGVSGIERYCDDVLRGTNGYRERLGLEDVYGKGARSILLSEVTDGGDVQLTLEPMLQSAAGATINAPRFPAGDPKADPEWFAAPVGAIVLLDPAGRVLAAASAPDANVELPEDTEGERASRIDRTLRAPGFQPVGSVFKPLVAVHALSRLDPAVFTDRFVYTCGSERRNGWASCGGVRCHSSVGHGALDLAGAIHVSCNTYFAAVGDLLGYEDLIELGSSFGFGQPTGVDSRAGSFGLGEAVPPYMELQRGMDTGRQMRLATNGLQIVQGTPMQVARSMCALATGELPELRLIDRLGGRALPRRPARELPYPDWALSIVRTAMLGVANDPYGSAYDYLRLELQGVEIAAKTGSADLTGGDIVRKHTWVGGWLPARDPQLIFCVFLHDTSATSSHSSVPVLAQLLESPQLRVWLGNRGVELGGRSAATGGRR